MTYWLDVAYVIAIALVVFFGYKKSRRFHQELQKLPEEEREEHLRKGGRLGFWEAGAVRKLPLPVAAIGHFLAILALLGIFVYFVAFGVGIYKGW